MKRAIHEERWFLITLFFCALIVRASVFHWYLGSEQHFWQVDSNTYHLIGTEMAQGNGYSLPDGQPAFYRLPGYPFFLSICYRLFGHSQENALWVQLFIASFIPLLVFFLSLTLFPGYRRLAKISALLSACHIGLVLYAGFFMSESLFMIFFLLFALFFFAAFHLFFCPKARSSKISNPPPKDLECYFSRCTQQNTIVLTMPRAYLPDPITNDDPFMEHLSNICTDEQKTCTVCAAYTNTQAHMIMQKLLLAGLFLGFASLIRPVGHYLIVVAAVLLLFQHKAFYKRIYNIGALVIGWAIPVSFLLLRNYLLLGSIFFHTLPGGHFLYLSAARVAMHPHHCSYQEARTILQDEVNNRMHAEEISNGRQLNEIERCRIHERLACSYFAECPLISLHYWATDMLRTTFSLYAAELLYLSSGRKEVDYFAKDRTVWSMVTRYLVPETDNIWLSIIIWGEIIVFFLILLGFLCGLIHIIFFGSANARCVWLRVLPVMALFIVISLAGGYARMRLPIEPFLIILSLYGWSQMFTNKTKIARA